MSHLIPDVRYACRRMRATPGITALAILTVALGVGASTAIFSISDAVLFRPPPFPAPDRIVSVAETDSKTPASRITLAFPTVKALRARRDVLDAFATWKGGSAIVVERAPERVAVTLISTDYFAVYGVRPIYGRDFTDDDMQPGAPPAAIVSYAFWRKYFNGDPGAIGQPLHLSDAAPVIVGVLPADFPFKDPVYRPLQPGPLAGSAQARQFPAIGRLKPGVTIERGRAALEPIARLLADPQERDRRGLSIEPYAARTARYARPTLRILGGAVAFVLLIACVNVAGLMFARGAARGREIALRASLGAGRLRIVQQLMTESAVLGIAGGAAGALLAWISLDAIVAAVPLTLPSTARPVIDTRVLAFALMLAIGCSLVFGLVPAWRLSRTELVAALGSGNRSGAPLSRLLSRGLIAVEVALTLVLVSGASLMLRSLQLLYHVDKGFDAAGVLTIEATPIRGDDAAYRQYYAAFLDRVRALPGIAAASGADAFPLGPSRSMTMITPLGDPGARTRGIVVTAVMPGFFETMRIPIRAGRAVAEQDGPGSPRVVVLNDSAARSLFPDGGAVGGQVKVGENVLDVVGVAADVRSKELSDSPEPEIYTAYRQSTPRTSLEGRSVGRAAVLLVRASGSAAALAASVRELAQDGEPAIVQRIRTLDEWIGDSARVTAQRTTLLTLLGALGLLLALVGVFGMTSYAVSQRTREIGVRVALGATARDIMRTVGGSAGTAIAIGVAAGLGATVWLVRAIESFLYEVTPADPIGIGAAAVMLGLAASAAAYLPARRALKVDPVVALRVE